MKKILVPIDGSKYSMKALKEAKELALKFDSELIVLTVISDILAVNVEYKIDIISQNIKAGEEMLENVLKDFEELGDRVRGIYRVGDISGEIVDFANEENVDLIVMGSRGLGVISRTFLGSISHKVLNNTEKSVLIVK